MPDKSWGVSLLLKHELHNSVILVAVKLVIKPPKVYCAACSWAENSMAQVFPLLNHVISVPKATSQAQRKRHFLPPPGFWLPWPLASVPAPPVPESICRIPHAPWRQNPSLKSVPLLNPTSRSSGRAPDCYSKTSYPWAAVWGSLAACRAVTWTGSLTDSKGPNSFCGGVNWVFYEMWGSSVFLRPPPFCQLWNWPRGSTVPGRGKAWEPVRHTAITASVSLCREAWSGWVVLFICENIFIKSHEQLNIYTVKKYLHFIIDLI